MLQDTDWVLEEPTVAANSDIACDDVVLAYVRPREQVQNQLKSSLRFDSNSSSSSS